MKLYRVTVTRHSTGKVEFRRIYSRISSVYSCRAYWSNRYSRPSYERLYDVVVQTAFVTDWVDMSDSIERVEKQLDQLGGTVTADQLRQTMLRLQAEYDARVALA